VRTVYSTNHNLLVDDIRTYVSPNNTNDIRTYKSAGYGLCHSRPYI